MRNTKPRLLQWLVAASAAGLLSFYGINTAVFPTPQPVSSGSNEYKFEVTNLAPLTSTGTINPEYRLVVYHDDGNYFMGAQGQLNAHTHAYAPGTYHPAMEVIARYDDGIIPPKRVASSGNDISVTGSGTAQWPNIDMYGKKILLKSTCSAVPGDSVTYIVTYDLQGLCGAATPAAVNGYIKLRFNKDVFEYRGVDPDPYHGESEPSTASDVPSTNLKEVVCNLTNLSTDKQRNIFFLLETKDGAPLGEDPMVSAILDIPSDGPAPCKHTSSDAITGQSVRNSHDPNYKEIMSNNVCDPQGFIEWRIHYQNEGNAVEDSVWITDWIDTLIDFNSVHFVAGNPSTMTVEQWKRPGERTANCLIRNIQLRGLGERGVREDETRGYITLRAYKKALWECNAIVNRARIRFGFKPPIETADEYAYMPCDTINCIECTTLLDTTLLINPIAVGDTIFNSAFAASGLFNMLQSASDIKWYPTDGLSHPFIVNPEVTKAVRRTYTLVASGFTAGSCTRAIIRVSVDPGCSLTLNAAKTLSGGTNCNSPNWDLTVTAAGAPSDHLMWHTGSTGVNSYSQPGLSPGVVYAGVWDTLTGCSAETWIKLDDKCTKKKTSWPWGAVLAVALVAVFGYVIFKFIKKG